MRIAFAGASGTGKTKLAEWASKEFDLPFNPVGSRSVAKAMGFDNPYDVDAAGKRGEFQRRLVNDKRTWEDGEEKFIVDRTTVDNLAYTMVHDIYSIDEELLANVRGGLERYTHIVLFPIRSFFTLSGDPTRVGGGTYGNVGDRTYHVLFEVLVTSLLKEYCPPTTKLLTMNASGIDARQGWMRQLLEHQPAIPYLPG